MNVEIIRGQNAERLLNDPLLKEALEIIEREVVEQWEACPVRDIEGREMLWKFFKTARKFRGILEGVAQSGKLAAMREKESAMDKVTNMFRGTNGRI